MFFLCFKESKWKAPICCPFIYIRHLLSALLLCSSPFNSIRIYFNFLLNRIFWNLFEEWYLYFPPSLDPIAAWNIRTFDEESLQTYPIISSWTNRCVFKGLWTIIENLLMSTNSLLYGMKWEALMSRGFDLSCTFFKITKCSNLMYGISPRKWQ